MRNRLFVLLSILVLGFSAPALAIDNAAWLAKVEGFYANQKNKTPLGEIPFAMDMVKEADGSVHGRTWADKDSYFDFKFYLNEKGELFFHETGALPGGLVQSHVLEVVKVEGDTVTFESKKAPGVLVAHVTADGKELHVNTIVRGKPHADLQMARVTAPEALAAFRASNERTKGQASNPLTQQVVQMVMQGNLADHVGEYEMPQLGKTLTVTFEAGKLFGEPTGGIRKEIKPKADGSFLVEGEPFQLRFLRDDKGKITDLQMSVNGQEMTRAKKIK